MIRLFACAMILLTTVGAGAQGHVELAGAAVVSYPGAEEIVSTVLAEEIEKRTGVPMAAGGSKTSAAIVIEPPGADIAPEGYRLRVEAGEGGRGVVRIQGADARGRLFGVGRLLRLMDWRDGSATVPAGFDETSAPAYEIRGHQLGYRNTANSYDAWDVAQYDQYIRELAFFGCNAIENIPFQCSDSPVMPVTRDVMNVEMSRICQRYGVDYWLWIPAEFDLEDSALRAQALDQNEALYKSLPHLTAIFFPGGDPGNNEPRHVMPFLKDLEERLVKHHPSAQMWVSLQGFKGDRLEEFFAYIDEHSPDWLTGVVAGPQSPPIHGLRRRLPRQYRLRDYPDITHTVLCQYPVPWWDLAYALTLGREPVNPRPRDYTHIFRWTAPATDGFITYSDGIHDDVNKIVWNMLGWDPSTPARDTVIEYARVFFGPERAEQAADALLALENNWVGPLETNGAVDATYHNWVRMTREAPELENNWRWRMHLFRAEYDYYVRHRQFHETQLEDQAMAALARAGEVGPDAAMDAALEALSRADSEPWGPEVRASLEEHGEWLFEIIGFQTSVPKHHARNFERGAVLDFLDRPLNNRWWLEDQFEEIRRMTSDTAKVTRLALIRNWENPVPGSFYDDLGNIAKMPRVERAEAFNADPEGKRGRVNASFSTHIDEGRSRWRLSWLSYMSWPAALVYDGLDTGRQYVLRLSGRGDAYPRVNGQLLQPAAYSREVGQFKEFIVPAEMTADGELQVTFDKPHEPGVNWRNVSIPMEVWLIPILF